MIDTLQIGPITYRVEERADLHYTDRKDRKRTLHGAIWHDRPTIQVESAQSDDQKLVTLWHEALHGILEQAGVSDHPEPIIVALGYGLVQLMRANPALVALTVGAERE